MPSISQQSRAKALSLPLIFVKSFSRYHVGGIKRVFDVPHRPFLDISRYRDIFFLRRRFFMPVLSRFYGIIIRMYFIQAEHNPLHIHAIYGDDVAEAAIKTRNSALTPLFAIKPSR